MTDSDVVVAIAKIIRTRPRLAGRDRSSVEARDLARYDQIVGLVSRHVGTNGSDDDAAEADHK
jgi:hypothetical protein